MEEREETGWKDSAMGETAATVEVASATEIQNGFLYSKSKTDLQTRQTRKKTKKSQTRYIYHFFKRVFDLLSSLFALIVLFFPLLVMSIVVKLTSKGSVFYRDSRVGLNGKDIRVLKYRTMYEDAEEHARDYLTDEQYEEWITERKVENDPRITPIGRFLRRTSIDELPQLVNILKGDLSVVGPRPLTKVEIETNFTSEERELMLSCKPGLTGNWGVHGRSEVTFESGERQRLELEYARTCGMMMDFKLIFETILVVVKGNGAK